MYRRSTTSLLKQIRSGLLLSTSSSQLIRKMISLCKSSTSVIYLWVVGVGYEFDSTEICKLLHRLIKLCATKFGFGAGSVPYGSLIKFCITNEPFNYFSIAHLVHPMCTIFYSVDHHHIQRTPFAMFQRRHCSSCGCVLFQWEIN